MRTISITGIVHASFDVLVARRDDAQWNWAHRLDVEHSLVHVTRSANLHHAGPDGLDYVGHERAVNLPALCLLFDGDVGFAAAGSNSTPAKI